MDWLVIPKQLHVEALTIQTELIDRERTSNP